MSDSEFSNVGSGASQCVPKQCSALRKGEYVVIKERPCKIVEMSTSKTGKHGHAKVHLVAIGIFDGKKYEDICPSTHNMQVPNVSRKELLAIDSDDGFLTVVLDNGDTRSNINLENCDLEVKSTLLKYLAEHNEATITLLSAMGREKVITCKTCKE